MTQSEVRASALDARLKRKIDWPAYHKRWRARIILNPVRYQHYLETQRRCKTRIYLRMKAEDLKRLRALNLRRSRQKICRRLAALGRGELQALYQKWGCD